MLFFRKKRLARERQRRYRSAMPEDKKKESRAKEEAKRKTHSEEKKRERREKARLRSQRNRDKLKEEKQRAAEQELEQLEEEEMEERGGYFGDLAALVQPSYSDSSDSEGGRDMTVVSQPGATIMKFKAVH